MKYEKFVYGLGALLVIAGAVMKILHWPYGNPVLLFAVIATSIFQTWHVAQLKRRIEELEKGDS